mmetsp:Transcript_86990/g.246644  ORF Transcript_86990/g.246644 Transcript_86990/m.246644 type:complete len:386 (-) Transcript_86990:4-1161(-)
MKEAAPSARPAAQRPAPQPSEESRPGAPWPPLLVGEPQIQSRRACTIRKDPDRPRASVRASRAVSSASLAPPVQPPARPVTFRRPSSSNGAARAAAADAAGLLRKAGRCCTALPSMIVWQPAACARNMARQLVLLSRWSLRILALWTKTSMPSTTATPRLPTGLLTCCSATSAPKSARRGSATTHTSLSSSGPPPSANIAAWRAADQATTSRRWTAMVAALEGPETNSSSSSVALPATSQAVKIEKLALRTLHECLLSGSSLLPRNQDRASTRATPPRKAQATPVSTGPNSWCLGHCRPSCRKHQCFFLSDQLSAQSSRPTRQSKPAAPDPMLGSTSSASPWAIGSSVTTAAATRSGRTVCSMALRRRCTGGRPAGPSPRPARGA